MADDPATVERAWAQEHPDPQESMFGDSLSLWNYAIGRADLAPLHQAAIRDFLQVGPAGPANPAAELTVRGHASASGADVENITLSAARADKAAAYIATIGIKAVHTSSAGSSEPEDRTPFGGAYARNRRVDVRRFYPSPTEGTTPVPAAAAQSTEPLPPTSGTPASASLVPDVSVGLESTRFALSLSEGSKGRLSYKVSFEGAVKVTLKGKKGSLGFSIAEKGKIKSAKFTIALTESLAARINLQPESGTEPETASVGIQGKKKWTVLGFSFDGKGEFGLQLKPNFCYVSGALAPTIGVPFLIDEVTVNAEFEGKLKLEFGPSSSYILTVARNSLESVNKALAELEEAAAEAAEAAVDAVAETAAAALETLAGIIAEFGGPVVVVLAIVLLINGGIIVLAESEEQAMLEASYTIARREGAAGRIALAIFKDDEHAAMALDDLRQQYMNADSKAQAAFVEGEKIVTDLLTAQKAAKDTAAEDMRKKWEDAYAQGANALDSAIVRNRIFAKLGGLVTTGERDLAADVKQL
jgi:hypothetical protein